MESVRRKTTNKVYSAEIEDLKFNAPAGADKVISGGHHLLPIPTGNTYTTAATTRIAVGKGVTLAIYNNTAGTLSATVGDITVTSQAVGAVQANTDFVGIALKPNDYTYLNTYNKDYVIVSAAGAIVYIVKDETNISQVP